MKVISVLTLLIFLITSCSDEKLIFLKKDFATKKKLLSDLEKQTDGLFKELAIQLSLNSTSIDGAGELNLNVSLQEKKKLEKLKLIYERLLNKQNELSRNELIGRSFEEVWSSSGKIYKKVEVLGLDPGGLKLKHENGITVLRLEQLPEDLALKVKFSTDEERQYAQKEQENRKKEKEWLGNAFVFAQEQIIATNKRYAEELKEYEQIKKNRRESIATNHGDWLSEQEKIDQGWYETGEVFEEDHTVNEPFEF